jgi:hypothetical protein
MRDLTDVPLADNEDSCEASAAATEDTDSDANTNTEVQEVQVLTDVPLVSIEHPCEQCGDILVGRYREKLLRTEKTLAEKLVEVQALQEQLKIEAGNATYFMDENKKLKSSLKQQQKKQQLQQQQNEVDQAETVTKKDFERFKNSICEKINKLTTAISNSTPQTQSNKQSLTPPPEYTPSREKQQEPPRKPENRVKSRDERVSGNDKDESEKTYTKTNYNYDKHHHNNNHNNNNNSNNNNNFDNNNYQNHQYNNSNNDNKNNNSAKYNNNNIDKAPWDRYNSGHFATDYMSKKGFKPGNGIGKDGNGITTPIKNAPTRFKSKTKKFVVFAGTSMIGGIDEHRLTKRDRLVKVFSHSGATIEEMKHHLKAHLLRNPDHLLLEVGTNDAGKKKEMSSEDIFNGIMDLKRFAEQQVPGIVVTILCPIVRTDDILAHTRLMQVKNRLIEEQEETGINLIMNENITRNHLSSRGLHLKRDGTAKLAGNVINFMKRL